MGWYVLWKQAHSLSTEGPVLVRSCQMSLSSLWLCLNFLNFFKQMSCIRQFVSMRLNLHEQKLNCDDDNSNTSGYSLYTFFFLDSFHSKFATAQQCLSFSSFSVWFLSSLLLSDVRLFVCARFVSLTVHVRRFFVDCISELVCLSVWLLYSVGVCAFVYVSNRPSSGFPSCRVTHCVSGAVTMCI